MSKQPKDVPNADEKYTYWLISLSLTYEHEGKVKTRHDNTFLTTPQPFVDLATLNHARFMYLQNFVEATQLSHDAIKHFVFNSFSNLGLMSDAEFQRIPVAVDPAVN